MRLNLSPFSGGGRSESRGGQRGRPLHLVVVLLVGACADPAGTLNAHTTSIVVTDTVPTPQMPIERLLADLADRSKTSGEVLIGVRERGAVRGVSTDGSQRLPRSAAEHAEQALRSDFPMITITRGVVEEHTVHRPDGVTVYNSYTTSVRARVPLEAAVFERLRAHAVVDYVEPNYINGVLR